METDMDSREEYRRYVESRERELDELGRKYGAETIPEMACRLYGYERPSYLPLSPAWKASVVLSVVLLIASAWSWVLSILSGVSAILAAVFIVLSKRDGERRARNRVYYSLMMYRKPLERDGWSDLVERYVHDCCGYLDGDGSVYIMTHLFRGRIYLPEVTNTYEWQSDHLIDAIRMYSIPQMGRYGDEKVHLDGADRELRPLLEGLSDRFYGLLGCYSRCVERRYAVDVLEGRLRRYRNLSEGAGEALDFEAKLHADRMAEETEVQLSESRKLLRTSESEYSGRLEDYQSRIGEIEGVASRVPGIVAKMRESKALDGLSHRGRDVEGILDYEESLVELN